MDPYILLTDDDDNDVRLVEEAFEQCGCTSILKTVDSGERLLTWLESHQVLPALIMLDINMPKQNGLEVLRQLKSTSKFRRIPVVMYSSSPSDSDVKTSYEAGANSYLVKPSTFSELVKTVSTLKDFWLGTAEIPAKHPYFQ